MKPEIFSFVLSEPLEEERRNEIKQLCSEETNLRAENCAVKKSGDMLLISELLCRTAINRVTGKSIREQRFYRTENGKPYLEGGGIFFSRSHSGDMCVCAVYDKEIGADIQLRRGAQRVEKIAGRFFSPAETEFLEALDGKKRQMAFFDLWARKESFIKFTGRGLSGLSDEVPLEREFLSVDIFDGYSCCLCI